MITATLKYYPRIIRPYGTADEFIEANGYTEYKNRTIEAYNASVANPSFTIELTDDGYEVTSTAQFADEAEYEAFKAARDAATADLFDGTGPDYAPIFFEVIAISN